LGNVSGNAFFLGQHLGQHSGNVLFLGQHLGNVSGNAFFLGQHAIAITLFQLICAVVRGKGVQPGVRLR
jgi:hypothetical protein